MVHLGPGWLNSRERVVACYDVGVVAMLLWHWAIVLRTDPSQTRLRAAAQDPGRDALFVLTLIAVLFGFVAAFSILGRGPRDVLPHHAALLYAIGFGAVTLGWLIIHTEFLFRYAHLYYRDRNRDIEIDRGLTFPGGDAPMLPRPRVLFVRYRNDVPGFRRPGNLTRNSAPRTGSRAHLVRL